MRSRIFEAALVQVKLYAALQGDTCNVETQSHTENFGWTVEKALSGENLNIIRDVLAQCKQPRTRKQITRRDCLTATQFSECSQFLLQQGLLAEADGEYVATKKVNCS